MNKTISIDVLVNYISELIIRFRGLLFIPIITSGVGLTGFGAYTQILSIITLLQLIFSLGLYDALIRFSKMENVDTSDLYYSLTTISIISGISIYTVIFFFSRSISRITLGASSYAITFKIGGFLIITRIILKIQEDFYRSRSSMKFYSFIRGIKSYAILGSVVAALYIFGGTVNDIFIAVVFVEFLLIISLQVLISRQIGLSLPTFQNLTNCIRYSVPLSMANLANNISSRVDHILIGSILGPNAVGVYAIAYQMSVVISTYIFPIRTVFFPEISELVESNSKMEISSLLDEGSRYFLIVAIPTVAGLYVLGSEIVSVLIQSASEIPTGILIATITFGRVVRGIGIIYTTALSAYQKTLQISVIRFIGAITNVILNILLIPFLGIFGAALTTTVTYVITCGLIYIYARKLLSLNFRVLTAGRVILCSVFMLLVLTNISINTLFAEIIAGVLLYVIGLFVTGEVTQSELKRAKNIFNY